MVVRDHFFKYGSCSQILQFLQDQQNTQAQANCGFTVLLLQKSLSCLRLTLLTDTGDMLNDFKTSLAFTLREYAVLCITRTRT